MSESINSQQVRGTTQSTKNVRRKTDRNGRPTGLTDVSLSVKPKDTETCHNDTRRKFKRRRGQSTADPNAGGTWAEHTGAAGRLDLRDCSWWLLPKAQLGTMEEEKQARVDCTVTDHAEGSQNEAPSE